jgi:hypothetical protein
MNSDSIGHRTANPISPQTARTNMIDIVAKHRSEKLSIEHPQQHRVQREENSNHNSEANQIVPD